MMSEACVKNKINTALHIFSTGKISVKCLEKNSNQIKSKKMKYGKNKTDFRGH